MYLRSMDSKDRSESPWKDSSSSTAGIMGMRAATFSQKQMLAPSLQGKKKSSHLMQPPFYYEEHKNKQKLPQFHGKVFPK